MKQLLTIIFAFISFAAFSQSQVDSSGQLAPLGNYPVTSAKFIKGAQRNVNTLAERDSIKPYLRDTGMLVYVTTLDSTYQLKGGLSNGNWVTFKTGGKGNSKTIFDTLATNGQSLALALFSGGGRTISLSTIGNNGSGFRSTYFTAGDSTYVNYDYAPSGQVIFKLTVIDASDTVSGGGTEFRGAFGTDTLVLDNRDTIVNISRDTIVVFTDTSGGSTGPTDYNTLINKPALKPVATSGLYADLTSKPTFATVATSGLYNDLLSKPVLKPVATSGLYTDLTGLPALKPVATSGVYTDLTGRPTFATVATSGLYADLLSKPTFATVATSGLYADLLSKPTFATVATSGLYNDLLSKPTIPAQLNLTASSGVIVSGTYPNINAKLDTNYLNTYLANHAVISLSNSCYPIVVRFGLLSEPSSGETLQQYQLTQRTADSLGIAIIRQPVNPTSGYSGLKALLTSNRQTQVNLRNTVEDGTRNFTSNTERAAYVTFLDTLFRNTLAPGAGDTLIVCANEDANSSFHTLDTSNTTANQSAARYFNNELKPMDSIANLYGSHFKVATGGANGQVGWYFVWKNLTDSGRTADAATLAQAVFPSGTNLTTYPTNASFALSIKYTLQLLPLVKASSIEYWNWHVTVITNGTDSAHINPDIIAWGVEAWKNLTGKNVITNQLASTSLNPNNLAEATAQASKYMDYVLIYDGSTRTATPTFAGNPVSLRNTNNSLNAIGVNIENVIQAIKR